jgi:hypothetical protein
MTDQEIAMAARELADQLAGDVRTARTRELHVMLTTRALAADRLARALDESEHFSPEP